MSSIYDRATFSGVHLGLCADCDGEVLSARSRDGAVLECEPGCLRFDVAWAVDHDQINMSVWVLVDGVLESVRGLVHNGGFERVPGDSFHLGHVCGEGVPVDWFERGVQVQVQGDLFVGVS